MYYFSKRLYFDCDRYQSYSEILSFELRLPLVLFHHSGHNNLPGSQANLGCEHGESKSYHCHENIRQELHRSAAGKCNERSLPYHVICENRMLR